MITQHPSKLDKAWNRAVDAQEHPSGPLGTLFSEYRLVGRDIQFSDAPVPEGHWFVDWGLARGGYGGYQLFESHHYGHLCRSKLASALCPKCFNPIFTVLVPNSNGDAKRQAKQLCLSCGYKETIALPRTAA